MVVDKQSNGAAQKAQKDHHTYGALTEVAWQINEEGQIFQ